MKEFVDQVKTRAEETEAKPNSRFDQSSERIDKTQEEDLPLGTIHVIGGPNHPNLENKIRGKIRMIRQMNEVPSIQSAAKKLKQIMSEPRSITFTELTWRGSSTLTLTPWSSSSG